KRGADRTEHNCGRGGSLELRCERQIVSHRGNAAGTRSGGLARQVRKQSQLDEAPDHGVDANAASDLVEVVRLDDLPFAIGHAAYGQVHLCEQVTERIGDSKRSIVLSCSRRTGFDPKREFGSRQWSQKVDVGTDIIVLGHREIETVGYARIVEQIDEFPHLNV